MRDIKLNIYAVHKNLNKTKKHRHIITSKASIAYVLLQHNGVGESGIDHNST